MVEIAKELIEPMRCGQHLVAVTKVILAELARRVTLRPEQVGDGGIFLLDALGRTRQSDLGETGAHRRLACDERGPTGSAALLAVPVSEHRALLGDAVDIRRLVTHHAVVVGAEVELADVVTPYDEDVGLLRRGLCQRRS